MLKQRLYTQPWVCMHVVQPVTRRGRGERLGTAQVTVVHMADTASLCRK